MLPEGQATRIVSSAAPASPGGFWAWNPHSPGSNKLSARPGNGTSIRDIDFMRLNFLQASFS
jgi:hypothetical protein